LQEHASHITAPYRHLPVTESVALPPDLKCETAVRPNHPLEGQMSKHKPGNGVKARPQPENSREGPTGRSGYC